MENKFSDILANFLAAAPDYSIILPDDWKQGRTAYGGMTAGLLLAAIQHANADLPPLRTAQINFMGPADGELRVTHKLLRQGKNNVTFEARLDSKLGAGTYGYFTFGVCRPMPDTVDYPLEPLPITPEDVQQIIWQGAPAFVHNFDRRIIAGNPLTAGMEKPELTAWCRHADPQAYVGLVPLMVLADSPPAALSYLPKTQALSSMTWNMNMLSDDITTKDGWWLMRARTDHIKDGYSSQFMQVLNRDGRPIMDGMQHQAIFV